MTPEQIAKLPKWARSYIDALERKVQDLESALAIGNGERGTGRVAVDDWRLPITLPDQSRIRFTFDERRRWMDVRESEPGTLRVMGSSSMVIYPHVTNVVNLKLTER